jgi:hypothetical protein
MPQQLDHGLDRKLRMSLSTASVAPMAPNDFWWQWPCRSALGHRLSGRACPPPLRLARPSNSSALDASGRVVALGQGRSLVKPRMQLGSSPTIGMPRASAAPVPPRSPRPRRASPANRPRETPAAERTAAPVRGLHARREAGGGEHAERGLDVPVSQRLKVSAKNTTARICAGMRDGSRQGSLRQRGQRAARAQAGICLRPRLSLGCRRAGWRGRASAGIGA